MMSDRLEALLISKRDHPAVKLILGILIPLHPLLELTVRSCLRARARRGRRLPRPVVSVGNITTGGTGKTSLVGLLLRHLEDNGLKVALLYRGYKRKGKGLLVLRCAEGFPPDHALCGDEPLMVSRWSKGGAIFVSKDRYEAGLAALRDYSPDVFLLDDGFQHVALKRDLEIVVVDCTNPFDNGRLLPFGMLREPVQGLERADLVVLTRCNQSDLVDSTEAMVAQIAPSIPVVKTTHEPYAILTAGGANFGKEVLRGKTVYLFSGIGNSPAFYSTVLECGARVKGQSFFPDHHEYSRYEIGSLVEECSASGAEWLLTTEKDLVRIPKLDPSVPIYALIVRMAIRSGAEFLWSGLENVLRRPLQEKGEQPVP